MAFKHILVDMDPTKEEQPAFERAIYLAQLYNAELELFLVDFQGHLVANNFLNSEQLERAKIGFLNSRKSWLEGYQDQAQQQGIKTSIDLCWHKPIYQAINIKAEKSNTDLVIKSTHYHPVVNRIFFTPNDWQLLNTCPVPLILAKNENNHSEYKRIMAAVDISQTEQVMEELTHRILNCAQQLSAITNADFHVTHCYESLGIDMWASIGMGIHGLAIQNSEYEEYLRELGAHNQSEFDHLLLDYNTAPEYKHLRNGVAHSLLPQIAKENNIDLMVVGTTNRSGLLGSTAEKILDQLECDIMAVR